MVLETIIREFPKHKEKNDEATYMRRNVVCRFVIGTGL